MMTWIPASRNHVALSVSWIDIVRLAKWLNSLGYVIRNGKLSDHTARPSFHQVTLLFPEHKEHQYYQHSRVEDEPVARPAELV